MNRSSIIRFCSRGTLQAGAAALLFCLLALTAPAQKKAYTLRGKVEAVNAGTKSLTVNHEKVDGWMEAMTMAYAVDSEDVLKRVKVGDRITAKVYDGDYTLHDVQVVGAKSEKPAKKP
jgi:Cu/Ag efflux protein CusF